MRFSFRLHNLQIYALFHNQALVVEVLSQRAPTIHSSFLVNLRTQKNVSCSEQNLWLLQIIPGLEEVLAGMRLGGSCISSSKQNMFMPSSWIMLHAELVYEHNYHLWSYVWLRRTFVYPRKEESLDSTRGWLHWCTPWTPAKRGKLDVWHTCGGIISIFCDQSCILPGKLNVDHYFFVLAVWTPKSPDVTCQGAPCVRGAIVED